MVLWHTQLNHHIQCRYSIEALVWIWAAPLLIHLSADVPAKAAEDGISVSTQETWNKLPDTDFSLAQPRPYNHGWGEPLKEDWSVVSPLVHNSALPINVSKSYIHKHTRKYIYMCIYAHMCVTCFIYIHVCVSLISWKSVSEEKKGGEKVFT